MTATTLKWGGWLGWRRRGARTICLRGTPSKAAKRMSMLNGELREVGAGKRERKKKEVVYRDVI